MGIKYVKTNEVLTKRLASGQCCVFAVTLLETDVWFPAVTANFSLALQTLSLPQRPTVSKSSLAPWHLIVLSQWAVLSGGRGE